MSRDDGFPIADVSVGFLRDVKIRRLRAHLPPDDVPAATVLYLALVLSSWEEGHRLTVDEADSPVPATPGRVAALRAVDLVDADDKIPARAWEAWFRPAWERRDKKRAGGREGNRKRWHPDGPDSPSDTDSDTDSHPDSPSVPSVRQSIRPSPRATTNGQNTTTTQDVATCPVCGDGPLDDRESNVARDRHGQLWHMACPALTVVAS